MTIDRYLAPFREYLNGSDLPGELAELAATRAGSFCERHVDSGDHWFPAALRSEPFRRDLALVWSCSSYVFEACLAKPDMFAELVASGDLHRSYGSGHYAGALAALTGGDCDEKRLSEILRQFRRREMVRLVWRDFTRRADLLDTTGDVTALAEACINTAIATLYPVVEAQMGTPIGRESGEPQHLVVLGMGKMGAWELNLSSDIDLIFAYPESGETRGGRKQMSNQEFFIRLGQKLIQALDPITGDGFVFRVDMRLRPYGESGALALNFDALEEYYQSQGRDWERYAMVKARVVAGRPRDGALIMEILRPFTYRKYIDFSAIQSLRDMKSLINREVARLGGRDDVKKGAGGIREVEFIAQAFQLVRGGKDRRFQDPSLHNTLRLLDGEQLLPEGEADSLWAAYRFLRNTEHVLQGMADKQTQLLPEDDHSRRIVALLMGFADWDRFYHALGEHRRRVKAIFAGIAAEAPGESGPSRQLQSAKSLWLGSGESEALAEELAHLGLPGAENAANLLTQLRQSRAVKALATTVRERLDNFIPLLIDQCAQMDEGTRALERILPLVEAILRRSAYLVLLIENPDALRQLVYLCAQSLWIAEQIASYPALLDGLLDPRALFTPADRDSIAGELHQEMLHLPGDDLDVQMDALRHFRRAQTLRIAACEVAGALPLMKVSDNLTWLAEVILERVLAMARAWMVARYGHPGRSRDDGGEPSLIVIGYGKLGGIELGHGSDLDLVFLHNADAGAHSDGERSIDNSSYFIRLCQRMIHILSTKTVSGDLYEVDIRLRPNGSSGLLVTSLAAFEKYQFDSAWTWEHQALVRARVVAGDGDLAGDFERIRREILCLPRDERELKAAVRDMRARMRSHLGSSPAEAESGKFNIKQDAGGIVDLEFVVQFAVLANAREFPDLTRWNDNMRILDSLESLGVLTGKEAGGLREAYIAYRSTVHRLQLQKQKAVVEDADQNREFGRHRQVVSAVYRRVLGESG